MLKLEISDLQPNCSSKNNVSAQFVEHPIISLLKFLRAKDITFKWIFGALELFSTPFTMVYLHLKLKMPMLLIKGSDNVTI